MNTVTARYIAFRAGLKIESPEVTLGMHCELEPATEKWTRKETTARRWNQTIKRRHK